MQIITEIPDGKPGRPDNQRSRFLKCQPGRDLPKKTEVATGRKRNAFLTGKVSPIATDYYMENETDETETNLTTSENFDFLYRSAEPSAISFLTFGSSSISPSLILS